MQALIKLFIYLGVVFSLPASAQQTPDIPPVCDDSSGTVALLDCLQNQQDVLRRILEYEQLATQITEIQTQHSTPPPPEPVQHNPVNSEPGMDRVNWFDQNLEVYAIVGSPESLTAYAYLDGREYRLQAGDTIRLAKVAEVHARGVLLHVSGHDIAIGLSGRFQHPEIEENAMQ